MCMYTNTCINRMIYVYVYICTHICLLFTYRNIQALIQAQGNVNAAIERLLGGM